MRITFVQTPAHAIVRLLAVLLYRLLPTRCGQHPVDEADLAQRVRRSGEW